MTLPLSTLTHSPEETEALGKELAEAMLADPSLPPFVAMYGDLGVGKTAFTRGFTAAVAPDARVKSPTFALVHEYRGKRGTVFHFDMYRITGEDDLYSIGFDDYLESRGICLCEWSENIPFALPEAYVRAEIRKNDPTDPDSREIFISPVGF
jgi:tRNA threonylcarbamoyladenosine biosynthesis protein TsaE